MPPPPPPPPPPPTNCPPKLHPELARALAAVERAAHLRFPALNQQLAGGTPPAPESLARDLYALAQSLDSLNNEVSRAKRMGGVLVRGMAR